MTTTIGEAPHNTGIRFDQLESFGDFKQYAIDLHNHFLPEEQVTDFDAHKNVMGGGLDGAMEGIEIRYPRREDKLELLEYAWAKSETVATQADKGLLLGASIVAVHPFNESNGRISRAVYTDALGIDRIDTPTAERNENRNNPNRQNVDLGSAFTDSSKLKSYLQGYVYQTSGVPDSSLRVGIHDMSKKTDLEMVTLSEAALAGLDPEEQHDLIAAIGADKYGNTYAKDSDGLAYSFLSLFKNHPELASHIQTKKPGTDRSFEFVDVHTLLPALSAEQKKEVVSGLWLHRKLQAKGVIDFLSDKSITTARNGGRIALRDIVIEQTTNLHHTIS